MKSTAIREKQTQSQIIADLAEETGLSKRQVTSLLEALANQAHRSLKPRAVGEFVVPKLGVKLRRVVKKATKARKGRNPFTGEEITIPAKPSRRVLKVSALKVAKDFIEG